MHVARLKLAGFKSFADPTELRIETGLTGVVGPNGCGKSNIVDAIRWVMGESSARGLRGGEMEDVIFAGSDARPSFDFAEVGLVLEPPSIAEGGAVEVVRRLGRGVGSSFRMNGREARARDIARMLADSAAGARSASIVGQGQIGALVEARPQERQRLLAEAAGIAGLQSRRREAELRLDAATANVRTLAEREATLQEQAGRLTKQAKEAERWRKVNQRHREVQVLALLARFVDAERRLEVACKTTAEAEAARVRTLAEAETAAAEAARASEALPELRAAEQRLAAERARLEERLAGRRAEADATRRALERSRERGVELARDLQREEQAAREAGEAVARLEAERRDAPAEAARLAEVSAVAAAAADTAQAKLSAAELAWQAAQLAMTRAEEAQLAAARAQSELESQAAALAGEASALEQAMAAAEAALARTAAPPPAVEALAHARAALAAAELRRAEARDALEAHTLARAEAATREVAAMSEVERARAGLATARSLAERRSEVERQAAALAGRRERALAERVALQTARTALDLAASTEVATRAEARAQAAQAQQESAREAVARAEEALRAQGDALATLKTEQARLEAERDALSSARAGAFDGDEPALAPATVPVELHRAVAAALGDDALAPVATAPVEGWRADVMTPMAALPADARALVELVPAPAALRARLAQAGLVADAATAERLAPMLAPGQRLTTPAGGLWRWDGFQRRPEALPRGADRLADELRLAELVVALATSTEQIEATGKAVDLAREQVVVGRDERDEAAAEREAAREAVAAAVAAHERDRAEAGRLKTALEAVEASLAELGLEMEPLAASERRLSVDAAALGELPDLEAAMRKAECLAATAKDELQRCNAQTRRARAEVDDAERACAATLSARDRCERIAGEELDARDAARTAAATEVAMLRERGQGLARRRAELVAEQAASTPQLAACARDVEATQAQAEEAARLLAEQRAERDGATAAAAMATTAVETFAREAERRDDALAQWRERLQASRGALGDLQARQAALADEQAGAVDPEALLQAVAELQAQAAVVEQDAATTGERRRAADDAAATAAERHRRAEAAAAAASERLDAAGLRAETAAAALTAAAAAARDRLKSAPESLLADTEVRAEAAAADADALEHELVRLEASRERLGAVNLRADQELTEIDQELATLGRERGDLERAVDELRRAIGELNREGRTRIVEAFKAVEAHFGTLFTRLFGGGRAELALAEDADDPLGAGLDLAASPPGKRLQALSLLSGGEKALTAIALIFAFFRTQPAPLCVLDEVDAPLDDANVGRLGELMAEISAATGTRFLVVTHHPLTMARMHRLYGVTMLERGLSSLVSVELEAAVALIDAS